MSEDADATDAEPTPAPPRKKKGKVALLVSGGVLLLLAVAGAGGYWWVYLRGEPVEAAEVEEVPDDYQIVEFDPFLVNVTGGSSSALLRTSLALVVTGAPADAAEVFPGPSLEQLRARSVILELLTSQKAEDLTTAEGRTALREAIRQAVSAVDPSLKVKDVLFSEFVLQF